MVFESGNFEVKMLCGSCRCRQKNLGLLCPGALVSSVHVGIQVHVIIVFCAAYELNEFGASVEHMKCVRLFVRK